MLHENKYITHQNTVILSPQLQTYIQLHASHAVWACQTNTSKTQVLIISLYLSQGYLCRQMEHNPFVAQAKNSGTSFDFMLFHMLHRIYQVLLVLPTKQFLNFFSCFIITTLAHRCLSHGQLKQFNRPSNIHSYPFTPISKKPFSIKMQAAKFL